MRKLIDLRVLRYGGEEAMAPNNRCDKIGALIADGWEYGGTAVGEVTMVTLLRYEEVADPPVPEVTMRQAMVAKLRVFAAKEPTAFSELVRCARVNINVPSAHCGVQCLQNGMVDSSNGEGYPIFPMVQGAILAHVRGEGLNLIFCDEDAF